VEIRSITKLVKNKELKDLQKRKNVSINTSVFLLNANHVV